MRTQFLGGRLAAAPPASAPSLGRAADGRPLSPPLPPVAVGFVSRRAAAYICPCLAAPNRLLTFDGARRARVRKRTQITHPATPSAAPPTPLSPHPTTLFLPSLPPTSPPLRRRSPLALFPAGGRCQLRGGGR